MNKKERADASIPQVKRHRPLDTKSAGHYVEAFDIKGVIKILKMGLSTFETEKR